MSWKNKDINSAYLPFCPDLFSNLTFLLLVCLVLQENKQPNYFTSCSHYFSEKEVKVQGNGLICPR